MFRKRTIKMVEKCTDVLQTEANSKDTIQDEKIIEVSINKLPIPGSNNSFDKNKKIFINQSSENPNIEDSQETSVSLLAFEHSYSRPILTGLKELDNVDTKNDVHDENNVNILNEGEIIDAENHEKNEDNLIIIDERSFEVFQELDNVDININDVHDESNVNILNEGEIIDAENHEKNEDNLIIIDERSFEVFQELDNVDININYVHDENNVNILNEGEIIDAENHEKNEDNLITIDERSFEVFQELDNVDININDVHDENNVNILNEGEIIEAENHEKNEDNLIIINDERSFEVFQELDNVDININDVHDENNVNILNEGEIIDAENHEEIQNDTEEPTNSRKRKRDENKWKKNVRKRLRNSGQEYLSVKGTTVREKEFRFFECKCNFKCKTKFISEKREEIHKYFYNLKDWKLQTMYIQSHVKVSEVKRKRTKNETSKRNFSHHYFFPISNVNTIEVCKNVFKHTLRISDQRISHAILKTTPDDMRGKHEPHNKTKISTREHIKIFLKKFPVYQSHYSRKKSPHRFYLSPSLNINIMYSLYKQHCKDEIPEFVPSSDYVFRDVFNKDFNYHFHPPLKDTCKTCNLLKNKIDCSSNEVEKLSLREELESHQILTEQAREAMKSDVAITKALNSDSLLICFDLMKTLPTPDLDVGICYYKRQLWTYLLGIHDMTTDEVITYLWNESIASRGPDEIASCLIHFFKYHAGDKSHIIMYSDQCGGQNKNIKLTAIMDYVVNSNEFHVKKIDHKFLIPGHTYLPCDQDFGLIEKAKKYYKKIYLPADWSEVVKNACKKRPFIVNMMSSKMFFSSKQLLKQITNRKKTQDGEKVVWRTMVHIQIKKDSNLKILYKTSFNENSQFHEVDLKKRGPLNLYSSPLSLLYPNGRTVDQKKIKDIEDLMVFIPPIAQEFYKNLNTSVGVEDILYTSSSEDEN
ncbi:uncharacterized protein LOC126878867 [Diabrotica virgifera virgifera]|uniref:Uncharacterized protein n=1 Tax=Diabrotica virgifera virgifera TaxID=50390 RepID=A0ABM5JIF1_DIAVI|nr:uncharacterized protein LOC126878867 [Diabrotica virgifera virgifera]